MICDSIPTTFWLTATNLLLGLAVILCLAVIVWCLVGDIKRVRRERKDQSLIPLDFLDGLKSLGVISSFRSEDADEIARE